jgi:uncharacterized membrane protein SpoIIM required for sporulation/uncharacterized RDD family membrane protein YckC
MEAEATVDLVRDRVLGVETPESVRIEYPLAGLGSRFAALLVDAVLAALLMLLVPLLVLLPLARADLLPGGLGLVLVVVWVFAVFWGYFLWFEAFRDGRTPGKRLLSIRVVMEDGTPVTFEAAVIRNLLRIVDIQPFPGCLVGGLFMLAGRRSRRLGDLAAGTVVVREQPIEFPRLEELPATVAAPRLDDSRYQVLETFVEQIDELEPEAKVRVAARLCHVFAAELADSDDPLATRRLLTLFAEETARRRAARLLLHTGSPAATQLLRSKRERWERFRRVVERVRAVGLRSLDEGAVAEFAARYRELTADLARARTYGASSGTIYALERLAGAAHNLLYRPVERPFAGTWRFLLGGFPRLARRLRVPIGVAALLLYGTGLLVFLLVTGDPDHERRLGDPGMIARAERAREPGTDYRDTWGEFWIGSDVLSSMIIANNVQVSFLAFAGGVLAGLGTMALLIFNGLHLGVAFAVFANRQVLENLGAFVLPHGFIELTAIAIAGGAGLWMGSGLVLPGRRRRLEAFASRAREAVALIGGVVVMLLVAGLVEGFLSPSRLPAILKVVAGLVFAAATLHYLLVVGRERGASDAAATVGRAA